MFYHAGIYLYFGLTFAEELNLNVNILFGQKVYGQECVDTNMIYCTRDLYNFGVVFHNSVQFK